MNPASAVKLPRPELAALAAADKRRRWPWFILKAVISIALISWVLSRAQLADVLQALGRVDARFLIAAFGLQLTGIYITAARWRGLLRAQGVVAPQSLLFRSCLTANFFRQFLPSTIGGDAIRAYDSWKAGASKSTALMALAVDRLLGLLLLILFAAAGLGISRELTSKYPALYAWVGLAAMGMVACTWMVFKPSGRLVGLLRRWLEKCPAKVQGTFHKVLDAATAYHNQHRALRRAILLSVILVINAVTFYFLVAQSVGFSIGYLHYYLIVPVAYIIMMIPVSINGIGLREGAFVFLLGAFGVSQAEAVAFAWLEYGMLLVVGLLGGTVYMLRK